MLGWSPVSLDQLRAAGGPIRAILDARFPRDQPHMSRMLDDISGDGWRLVYEGSPDIDPDAFFLRYAAPLPEGGWELVTFREEGGEWSNIYETGPYYPE